MSPVFIKDSFLFSLAEDNYFFFVVISFIFSRADDLSRLLDIGAKYELKDAYQIVFLLEVEEQDTGGNRSMRN